MKESGVVCKKKKVYLLSLLLFLISYLTTVVNMIVNIITGSFHLYIFSTLSFMLPCYKSIKTTDVFGIVLTILLFLISFLLIFFTVKYDVLKYDQSKRPLCYTSLLLWFFITQILSSWILVDSHFQNYIYLSVAEFYESEELQYMNSIIIFGIYQLIIQLQTAGVLIMQQMHFIFQPFIIFQNSFTVFQKQFACLSQRNSATLPVQ